MCPRKSILAGGCMDGAHKTAGEEQWEAKVGEAGTATGVRQDSHRDSKHIKELLI